MLEPTRQRLPAREADLGDGMRVRRALPTRLRRMVGPWCFLDHFGPVDVSRTSGMRVPPHPHLGLQTVTWLFEGEVVHRDSLGSHQRIVPGQLNVMTSGRGIAHSETSPAPHPPALHGLQLWIALPDEARHLPAAFDHHPTLPTLELDGLQVAVMVGEALGQRSPARLYSPAVGLDLRAAGPFAAQLPLDPAFEHAALVTAGAAWIDGEPLQPGALLYLGGGRDALEVRAEGPARLTLLGGAPFQTPVQMWWNFVARTREELSAAVRTWNDGGGFFGEVQGDGGERLLSPVPPWSTATQRTAQ